jgi:copper chaperone
MVFGNELFFSLMQNKKIQKMKTEILKVANMKCDGCATTIKNELKKINGLQAADVDIENDSVTVTYDDAVRDEVVSKLLSLGYPEATEKNGLLLQLKSYASCMMGRASNLKL